MRPAGVRTTLAWRFRVIWRWLRTRAVLAQLALEDWWRRHIADREPETPIVFAIPWIEGSGWRPCYRDGRADVHVTDGSPVEMVEAYLHNIQRPAPREVIG